MDLLARMKTLALFAGIPDERLKTLAARALHRRYAAEELLVGEADSAHALYVVLTGRVKLYKLSAEGREQTINLLGPGDPFGMCTAFASDVFPVNALALEESDMLLIPGPAMEAFALQEPRLLLNIIRLLSARLRESMELIETLSLKELPQRIATFLSQALAREGNGTADRLSLAVTQRELAKILGVTPEALSRAFKRLTTAGILSVNGRSVRILDQRALTALADGA